MLDEALYRLGNSMSPRLDHIRPKDVDTYERNSIAMVRANGKGLSLLDQARLNQVQPSGWALENPG